MIIEPIEPGAPDLRAALEAAALPADDLGEPGRTFFRLADRGRTVGFAGMEVVGADVLLRSLVIAAEARGKGLGRRAAALLIDEARAAGARHAYLLTTDTAPFFAALGFEAVARRDAPSEILATRQAASLCPSTATLMARAIGVVRK